MSQYPVIAVENIFIFINALQAMNDLNGMRIEDCNIEVTLAKPGNKKKDGPGRGG